MFDADHETVTLLCDNSAMNTVIDHFGSKVKTTGQVNLRTGAGLDYNNVCAVPEGTSLTWDEKKLDERGVAWYHVSYQGKTGWVSSRYARKQ